MVETAPRALKARKRPRQARAAATVDAIFEAAIQVLLADGPRGLTTTRVAERAGVSVGTLYQYYGNKQALLYALNERYMDVLAAKVESTCLAHHGQPIAEMVEALVTTYWRAKTERAEVTLALYQAAVELDTESLIGAFARRVDAASAKMLASAPDGTLPDLAMVNLTLLTAIFGTVRNVFDRNLAAPERDAVYRQLIRMCRAYVDVVKTPSD